VSRECLVNLTQNSDKLLLTHISFSTAKALLAERVWKRQSEELCANGTPHPVLKSDVLQHVFSFLTIDELRLCASVSKNFYATSLRNSLWKYHWQQQKPTRPFTKRELDTLVRVKSTILDLFYSLTIFGFHRIAFKDRMVTKDS
jgi:hypothetical protein